jgi:hypothetical protein
MRFYLEGFMRWLLSLLLLPSLASAEIYRWTDEQGRVHFGQRPAGAGAQQIEVRPQVIERDELTRERQERATRFYEARQQEQAQAAAQAAERRNKLAQECRDLRSHLAEIPEGRSYYRTADDGQLSYLTDQEVDAARRQLRDRISERCS